jgi:2-dehydropantoate 2-reductase
MSTYVVIGAGAIGGLVGARLSDAGHDVTLVVRPAHVESLRRDGVVVNGSFPLQSHPNVTADFDQVADLPRDTIFLLATKSQSSLAALDQVAPYLHNRALACLQNGVRNEAFAKRYTESVYGVMVRCGSRLLGPGAVAQTAPVGTFVVGQADGGVDHVCHTLALDLNNAPGFSAETTDQVMAYKWNKLVSNLLNAVCALCDLTPSEALGRQDSRWFIADVWQEAVTILDAAHIDYDPAGFAPFRDGIAAMRRHGDDALTTIEPIEKRPSTWQDLHFGRPTVEVDFFNGEIVQQARSLGRQAPLNELLTDRCNEAATAGLGPGCDSISSLRQRAATASSTSTAMSSLPMTGVPDD